MLLNMLMSRVLVLLYNSLQGLVELAVAHGPLAGEREDEELEAGAVLPDCTNVVLLSVLVTFMISCVYTCFDDLMLFIVVVCFCFRLERSCLLLPARAVRSSTRA